MTDCLIIGGGVIGLSLAYELAGRGCQVQVIDRGEPGREASWAGAGVLPPANRATAIHPLEQLRALAHELHPRWAARLREETGIDTGFRLCGGIYLARSNGEAASLHALAEMLRDLKIDVDRLSPHELSADEPALQQLSASGALKAAYLFPDEAQLRNPDHLRALQVAGERRGVVIQAGVEAQGFELAGSRILAVQTSAGRIAAERFCITGGSWTQGLLQPLGITTGILPIRGQMVLFRCAARPFRRVLNEGSRYLVPRDDGLVLAGSTEEEVGFDKRNTEEGIADLASFARDLVPVLRDAPLVKTWAGLRPGTFDSFPYLGRLPHLDNAFAAAGHFRSGLHMSPATAVVMAQLILGQPTEVDLSPFRVGRG